MAFEFPSEVLSFLKLILRERERERETERETERERTSGWGWGQRERGTEDLKLCADS